MNIQDRLRHCAKHTGLDAVVELLNEAAAHIEGLNSIHKVQGEPSVDQLRELLSAHKLAAVPMRATHAMLDVMSDEDWQWADLLAAAEAITEDEYEWIERTPQPAQATQAEVTDADIDAVTIQQWGDQRGAPLQAHRAYARAILALRPVQSGLTGCNCRWDGDTQVQWCELHLAHKEAIHEWAERAKEAEKQLALRPAAVPMTDEVFDLICNAIDKADTISMEGDYMLDSDDCIAVVRVMQALLSAHHGITAQAKKEGV